MDCMEVTYLDLLWGCGLQKNESRECIMAKFLFLLILVVM